MEVDDAVSSPPVAKATENGRSVRHAGSYTAMAISAEEDPPGGPPTEDEGTVVTMDVDETAKATFSTPFKLRVSEDEDSQDGGVDSVLAHSPTYKQKHKQERQPAAALGAARQQNTSLYIASEEEEVEGECEADGEGEGEGGGEVAGEEQTDEAEGFGGSGSGSGSGTLKRKRYEVRRSGSEECLLGFDEQSGEAELVKDSGENMLQSNTSVEKIKSEQKTIRASVTPPLPKKSKQSSILEKSTKKSAAASSPAATHIKEQSPKIETKAHVVGDTEESTNGTASLLASSDAGTPRRSAFPINKKPLPAHVDFYKKPFEYGWKRELVWRANMETSKDKADVYFITPGGKKLRARNDIIPLLEGDLTIEHFSFTREPLGVGPEFEIVRSAKPSSRLSITQATLAAAPTPTNIGKRVSKPKGPKGASPPPQGWTPTRALKVNNAALLSSGGGGRHVGSSGGGAHPSTPPGHRSGGSGIHTSAGKSSSRAVKKPNHNSLAAANAADGVTVVRGGSGSAAIATNVANVTHEPCTAMCARAHGEVPQLQCIKCLCLYHHECVGESGGAREYVCEACQPKLVEKPKTHHAAALARNSASPSAAARTHVRVSDNKFPQTIAVVKGKKYVMVAKPKPAAPRVQPNAYTNDIENDLKQIKESINNIRKPASTAPLDAAFVPHGAVQEYSNKLFANNFFANVSLGFEALLSIFKYLKIHERPRAASVCKLWNLASKDTSLWRTVRMKNSKICNWAGFAGALRRGETKHLDLRKMLLASTRSEEMWQDFSEYIGTVYSLEIIDLCRCSARVVESLFQSNKNLRVLNAIAITGSDISLNHISNLQKLEELRLRTCEAAILEAGGMQPLSALSQLAHLSLTAIHRLGAVPEDVEVLGELTGLRSLELGECGALHTNFAELSLPKLTKLQRLRLENGQDTDCCTLKILEAVSPLEQLTQLELVNFDIKPGFDERLRDCTHVRKLLIIPTYISQSATTNHIVLKAVQQVSDTLQVFTWGVTVELLRVTALYVDQCEESTKKQKHHFDECIPVLKPVPGAPQEYDDDGEGGADSAKQRDEEAAANDMPQIEILPLDKVESILGENLPSTKYTIVKVPYHATCKQQLVE